MKIFAWNSKREKDTVMTPYDSIKYHRQMEQASFMVMDPVTGEVRAWVGGINFKTYKYDHVNLKTKRQVGSTIKPFLYTQAMEERGFTPETECENVSTIFPGHRLGALRKKMRRRDHDHGQCTGIFKKLCHGLYHETGRAPAICRFSSAV